ncbi:MAG: PQQ-binding-like beta-propeller repeat protein [Verrucomicrobiales bacterium]
MREIASPKLIFLLLMLPLQAADWAQWRGPQANGISAEALPANPDFENILWRQSAGIGFSSLAVADGRVYTMGHSGGKRDGLETLWCWDAATGAELWSDTYQAPLIDHFYEGGPGATPTVRGGTVYTYSKHGQLHAYEAATGKLLWKRDMVAEAGLSRPPEWGFACSPCFAGENLLLIEAGATFGLDPVTGAVLWKGESFTPAYGTPKVFIQGGRKLAAVMKTEGLLVLDTVDGTTVAFAAWKTPFDTSATTPIVVAGAGNKASRIFISTGYDRGCALFELDADSGELNKIYEKPVMSNHMNNSVLIEGNLYGFDGTAHRGRPTEFVCMELATGKELYRLPPGEGLGCGSVMATGGGKTLLILTERGELVAAPATPEGFVESARAQVLGGRCWSVPVLANGRIYGRNAKGDVFCLGVARD